ncbi:hypothetical protein GCM10011414_22520 [Croceivirga lutea]|uniref:M14 family metallopeptidase n=1 Tax=Croceivirga lutea TaxID=1775167 RepID=UPI00163B546C|nr:M14 family metallopeptidase [Croceivirga lutea]GGG52429.1 hypothetical protein GCM10011414_22520 [Croceivirga lutea]
MLSKSVKLLVLLFVLFTSCGEKEKKETTSYPTKFEDSKGEETSTYDETIEFYKTLAKEFPEINIQTVGLTDSGEPLHIVTYNPEGNFNFQKLRDQKSIILINNGIHPGESDGIDATQLLFRDFAEGKLKSHKNVVLVTIPVYNIGGMLNRNSTTRVNQNGPKAYGFRGNARNYDLNRDFIKADTKNAKSFAEIFHLIQPDVFIDNHVSNGADYQYVLTHLFTQHNKLGGNLGEFLENTIRPEVESELALKGWPITPYVNVFNRSPEFGFSQFLDNPRYSTGYTTLWNTLGVMVETHMLKPYKQRVEGTYQFMITLAQIVNKNHKTIKNLRTQAQDEIATQNHYYFNWAVDTIKSSTYDFKGFELDTLVSEVTGLNRIKYHRDRPFEKEITYQNYFYPKDTVEIPAAYIVKKGWQGVIERLEANQIEFLTADIDTTLLLESYQISDYKTYSKPYEGHYPHYNTTVNTELKKVKVAKGDILIPTNQKGIRYLLETLEPIAPDSFFNWNFFDTILQRKEGFSPYVFEDLAYDILIKNQVLRDSFISKKEKDSEFAKNWYSQLHWVFENSKYSEAAYLQYPVYRVPRGSNAQSFLLK